MTAARFHRSVATSFWQRLCGAAMGLGVAVCGGAGPAHSAVSVGAFVNMDFETWERATPPFQFLGDVRVQGWVQPGKNPFISIIRFNNWNLGDNPDIWISTVEAGGVLEGLTSINVLGTYWLPNTPAPPRTADAMPGGGRSLFAAIEQTGQIPAGYASMRFSYTGSLPIVFVGGQHLSPVVLGNRSAAVDVTAFAGETVPVQFRADYQDTAAVLDWGSIHYARHFRLDDIYFSTEPIPEPSALLLLGVGALGLGRRRRMHGA